MRGEAAPRLPPYRSQVSKGLGCHVLYVPTSHEPHLRLQTNNLKVLSSRAAGSLCRWEEPLWKVEAHLR